MKQRYTCIFILLCLICMACNFCTQKHPQAVYNEIIGVDLSHYNAHVDFNILRNNNIYFSYIKSTEGVSLIDSNYKKNVQAAREHNIIPGAYHFYIFSLSGYEQAIHFIKNSEFKTGDLIPAIDIETSDNNPYARDSLYLQRLQSEIEIFSNEVYKHLGKHPIIYCNKEMYALIIKDSFANNPLWIVDLNNEPDSTMTNWRIWQYAHDQYLEGKQKVNLNKYRFNKKAFAELQLTE